MPYYATSIMSNKGYTKIKHLKTSISATVNWHSELQKVANTIQKAYLKALKKQPTRQNLRPHDP